MSRPFIFRLHAAELFAQIQPLNNDEKAAFITQFSIDLITLNGTTDYSRAIIADTLKLIESKRENGKKGGRPKTETKAKVKLNKSGTKAKSKQEEELEVEEEIKELIKPLPFSYPEDFISFWDAYPKKTAKGAAYTEWKKLKPPLQDVLRALEWQTVSQKWREGYILDPERYIKRRCWEDEPATREAEPWRII